MKKSTEEILVSWLPTFPPLSISSLNHIKLLKKKLLTLRQNVLYLFTQQRKYKIETEVENWIQKFDGDMGDRQVIRF